MAARKDKAMNMDKLAAMIEAGFDQTASKFDVELVGKRIDKVEDRLRVVETKLDKALYHEVSHLESRITRLEQKAGIK